jgi:uncharacterized protein YjbJ (UPF0337 family)
VVFDLRTEQSLGAKPSTTAGVAANEFATKGITMNCNVIEGNWKQFKGHVKEEWGKLTDDHLEIVAGRREQLAGRFQVTYGLAEDQAELQIKTFEQIRKGYAPKLSA